MKALFLTILIIGTFSCSAQTNIESLKVDKRQLAFNNDTTFIKAHPDSLKSVILLNFHYSSLPYNFVLSCFQKFNIAFSKTKEFKELSNKILLGKSTEVGTRINNFLFETNKGTTARLDTMVQKNKLTLLDFWASWCWPCRKNMDNIKRLYKKYHTSGFSILSISIEKEKDDWKRAIEIEDIYNFSHGIDDTTKSIQTQLGIFAIPTYILLNNKMQVVGKYNSRWKGQADLEKFLDEYLKQN